MRRNAFGRLAAATALTLGVSAGAEAAVINFDNSAPIDIPGLTGFATNGAMMGGTTITAYFEGGFSQALVWAPTGAVSGGVSGTGWALNQSGDTFGSMSWAFTNTGAGTLTRLVLDGTTGFTIFDVTNPNPGTPDSASGANWVSDLANDASVVVTYRNPTTVNGNAFVGDLYQVVDIDFTPIQGTRLDFNFRQDTDNDSRLLTPEPSMLALFGLGLIGAARARRRNR